MCRHAAYVGPGIAASELLSDLSHGLLQQSYQARELLTGVVCADGYGFGWNDDEQLAGRYAFAGPIWSDGNLHTMANKVRGRIVMGAVRNATVTRGNTAADAAPFQHGKYLWSLNGYIDGFDAHWREGPFKDWIDGEHRQAIHGQTDGEYLFAAWLQRIDEGPVQALQSLLRDVLAESRSSGYACQLNLLASDGQHVMATRSGSGPSQNSLYTLHDGQEFPDAWVVASEPLYDDPLWEPVDPDSLLVLQGDAPAVRLKA